MYILFILDHDVATTTGASSHNVMEKKNENHLELMEIMNNMCIRT
jgi:hypothetical protein